MPFTPYHFGPGILVKSVLPDRFSLAAYVLTEVVIDTEVLLNIIQHKRPLHGRFHTMIGAVGLGLVIGVTLFLLNRHLFSTVPRLKQTKWFRDEFALGSTLLGGVTGGLGGSLLDSLMHADVEPFWPFSSGNKLVDAVGTNTLLFICVLAGIVGLLILLYRQLFRKAEEI